MKPAKDDELTSRIRSLLEHEEKERIEKELAEQETQEKTRDASIRKQGEIEHLTE